MPPICVADKPKRCKKLPNVFVDNWGFPNKTEHYDALLRNIDGSVILQKLKHPPPPLNVVDPIFLCRYNEATHGERMHRDLDLSHLEPHISDRVYDLVIKYWSVFDENEIFVPVKNYEGVIDTGDSPPIAVKRIMYGLKETPIMRKAIAALKKVGHIHQITEGRWLFKALLAPKPYQEHIQNIDDFVWCFCINYIPLNSVMHTIAYPIPQCDSAINKEFGMGVLYWLFDAPMGYHQLSVAPASQEKLAFQGLDAIKWTYQVMPFGPTNGPATFINFIYNVNSQWKALAAKSGLEIDDNTNTKIIVNDIFSWGKTLDEALLYIECQLQVCQSYCLSLSLCKSHIFPKRFEFVGIDVCSSGNRPAMSKHQLLEHWPPPETICDVAKFVGFAQFYSKFIPNFELWISLLCNLTMKFDYMEPATLHWWMDAQHAFDEIKNSILLDSRLLCFNHQQLIVLCTDFSSHGMG